MNTFNKEFLKDLREKRTSYADMIDFCCDSLILNNSIMEELAKNNLYFELYCGDVVEYIDNNGDIITSEQADKLNYDEYESQDKDFYQYYIISKQGTERLSKYTNEVVLYNEELDLYLLAVDHFGTGWRCMPANWKELDEINEEE